MERWLADVGREGLSSAQDLSTAQLRDHVPELLDGVFATVEGAATPAGSSQADPGAASVLRGFRYSTGAFGGALYGAAWTDSPSAASAGTWLSSTP